MQDDSFKEFVLDQLNAIPDIRAKGMFGGFGLYQDTTFFGIISDDVLYFKTNEHTRKKYQEHGSGTFVPNEKQTLKNYYEVPAEILENADILVEWADEAIGISS